MTSVIYNGDVVVQKVLDSSRYKNKLLSDVIDGILRNKKPSTSVRYPISNTPTNILGAFNFNFAKKVDKMLNWARYHHPDDIPTNIYVSDENLVAGTPQNYIDPPAELKDILTIEVGTAVHVSWYFFGKPKEIFLANYYIKNDPENKFIFVFLPGPGDTYRRVFKENATGKYFSIGRVRHLGTELKVEANEVVYYDGSSQSGDIGWLPIDTITKFTFNFSLFPTNHPAYEILSTHRLHQVIYKLDSTHEIGYWLYNESTATEPYPYPFHGTIPYSDGSKNNEGFPFITLIHNRFRVDEGHLGEEYITQTNAILRQIGLSIESIMESFDGTPDDPNPSGIDEDLDDMVLLFGADINSDNNADLQYIYEHFKQFYITWNTRMTQAHNYWKTHKTMNANYTDPGGYMLFYNNRYQVMVRFHWITMIEKTGLIKDIPVTNPSPTELEANSNIIDPDPNNTGSLSYSWANPGNPGLNEEPIILNGIDIHTFKNTEYIFDNGPDSYSQSINDDVYILRKQLTDGRDGNPAKYVEMRILGLVHESRLTNPNEDITQQGGGAVLYIVNRVTDVNEDTQAPNGKFFIPISVNVLSQFNSIIRSEILFHGLSLVMTFYNKTYLPWYADKNFMLAIQLALLIATMGSSGIWTQGFLQIIIKFSTDYAIQLIVLKLVEELVQLVGGEAALILATIAVAIAAFSGNISNSFELVHKLLSAENLLKGATLLIDAINADTQRQALELQNEISEFNKESYEREQELEELQAQLDVGVGLDYTKISTRQPLPNFYENPSDFFNRSVHITNPGVLSLDTIDSYISNALALPQFRGKLS